MVAVVAVAAAAAEVAAQRSGPRRPQPTARGGLGAAAAANRRRPGEGAPGAGAWEPGGRGRGPSSPPLARQVCGPHGRSGRSGLRPGPRAVLPALSRPHSQPSDSPRMQASRHRPRQASPGDADRLRRDTLSAIGARHSASHTETLRFHVNPQGSSNRLPHECILSARHPQTHNTQRDAPTKSLTHRDTC